MRTADMPPPRVDPHHPANVTLLRTMRAGNPDAKPIRTPDEVPDPYFECGAHPDIVEHVWERIGTRLPKEARCLLFGTPALVQPTSGVVLVICMGTAYFLRVPSARRGDALAAGSLQSIGWNPHDVRDLEKDYGEDWFVGGSEGDEVHLVHGGVRGIQRREITRRRHADSGDAVELRAVARGRARS
jgi:hypothetical protein